MIPPRTMTALTADARIVRLRTPLRLLHRAESGGMAVQAPPDRLGRDGTAPILTLLGGKDRVVDRPVPFRVIGVSGQAVHTHLPLGIAGEERLTLMVRSQGVLQHADP